MTCGLKLALRVALEMVSPANCSDDLGLFRCVELDHSRLNGAQEQ